MGMHTPSYQISVINKHLGLCVGEEIIVSLLYENKWSVLKIQSSGALSFESY